jgi:outer membrane biosynthesis protein TonB
METLKFSIDVNVNISFDKNTSGLFSNAVNAALAGILSGPRCHCNAPTIEPAEKVAEKPAEKVAEKPAEKVAEKPAEKVAEKPAEKVAEKPAEKVAEKSAEKVAEKPAEKVAEKPAATTGVSIEDVRKALASKVNEHRQEIKEKLEELGAPSVTKLDPSKYEEMYNYLTSL